jgi:hypothetical protein
MTCTSVTEHSNSWALTYRPGYPNVWYMRLVYPAAAAVKPSYILIILPG